MRISHEQAGGGVRLPLGFNKVFLLVNHPILTMDANLAAEKLCCLNKK
jgi:hypothetical protein